MGYSRQTARDMVNDWKSGNGRLTGNGLGGGEVGKSPQDRERHGR